MNNLLDTIKNTVRKVMRSVAVMLNKVSGGHIGPNSVTIVGLLAHLPIAWLIATGHFVWAAVFLVIFGLFDTLDGELARLQGKASRLGMLLDSVSDRVKEAVLYAGIGYYLVESAAADSKNVGYFALLSLVALGGSMLVSYVNAWGEVVTNGQKKREVNSAFRIGLMRFEVRMSLLAIGLLFDWLVVVVVIIALLSWTTALERLINVSLSLKD